MNMACLIKRSPVGRGGAETSLHTGLQQRFKGRCHASQTPSHWEEVWAASWRLAFSYFISFQKPQGEAGGCSQWLSVAEEKD